MSSQYVSRLIDEEREKLDRLVGAAMLDSAVYKRLISEQDSALFDEYELSRASRDLICTIDASSLTELAEAIVSFEERFAFFGDNARIASRN